MASAAMTVAAPKRIEALSGRRVGFMRTSVVLTPKPEVYSI
jgi:hypothetical protein